MKVVVRVLLSLTLLLVAVPSFALCGPCEFTCNCGWEPGYGARCRLDPDCCYEVPAACRTSDANDVPTLLASQYLIASVEISTPAKKETVKPNETRLARNETRAGTAQLR